MNPITDRLFNTLSATALLTATICTPLIASAQVNNNWANVLTDSRKRNWFVDTGSIRRDGPYRYFWSYILSNTPYEERGKQVYGTAYYLSADCKNQQFRLRYMKLVGQNAKVLGEYDFGQGRPLGRPTSGTGEAASLKFVCSWKK